MIWGRISLMASTGFHILHIGMLSVERYITDFVEPYVVPFASYIGFEFLLMHDNARPHAAICVGKYLRAVDIRILDWPVNSPDLNLRKHEYLMYTPIRM